MQLDLNTTTGDRSATVAVPVNGRQSATVQGEITTGSWATAVVTVQRSNDGVNWYGLQSAVTLSGEGMTDRIDTRGFAFLRAAVTTAEGSAALAEITIILTEE